MQDRDKFAVLVAEDFAKVRNQIEKSLKAARFRPISAVDGLEAIAYLNKNSSEFFCLLLDLTLPKYDGFAVLKWMKQQNLNIPVIVMLEKLDLELVTEIYQKFGIKNIVQKPLDIGDLLRRLTELYPNRKKVSFISKREETLSLLKSQLNADEYEWVWVDDFQKAQFQHSDITIFNFTFQDRDFQSVLQGIDMDSISGKKFVIGMKKVVDYANSMSGNFNGAFCTPIDFDQFKQALGA